MNPITTTLVVGISVAALAFVAYALVSAWRKVMRDKTPLPLYGMLTRMGLTAPEAAEQLGIEAVAHAARRCALCGSSEECQQRVAAGTPPPADCPNGALFSELTRPQA
ncbi:MAG: DUF6455 family protein [Burkholderiales bacterium]